MKYNPLLLTTGTMRREVISRKILGIFFLRKFLVEWCGSLNKENVIPLIKLKF